MVSFVDAVKMYFGRYIDFQGRSSRSEFWWVQLFILLGLLGLFSFVSRLFEAIDGNSIDSHLFVFIFIGIFWLVILIPSIALSVRRFHDLNQTGWLFLAFNILSVIPVVNIFTTLWWLIWFCMRGTVGPNKYGEDPLGGSPEMGLFD